MSAPEAATAGNEAERPLGGTATWTEEDFITALARLEDIQTQIATIRLVPKKLIHSLTARNTDTTVTLHQFSKTVLQATNDITKLKTTWEDKRTDQIVQQAEQNWHLLDQEYPTAEEVPLFGWREKVDGLQTKSKQFGDVGEEPDLDAVVEETKDDFEEIEWVGEGHEHLKVKTKGKAIKFSFDILANSSTKEGKVWDVTAIGKFPLTRVLRSREKKGDVKYLLSMLADFKTLGMEKCTKCSNHLDRNGNLPYVRKERLNPGKDQSKWIPLHEEC